MLDSCIRHYAQTKVNSYNFRPRAKQKVFNTIQFIFMKF